MWIAVFLPMAQQFNWIDAVITPDQDTRLASVAKNKLIGKAALWLDTEGRGGAETDIWDTIVQNLAAVPARLHTCIDLKDGLISMFKVDISQLEATEAVMDLVMKSNETINVFYVWVKWAMEVKNHSISMADKALAPYIADRHRDLFTFFLAGVPSKYREFAMSGESPPTDPTTLQKRCAQLEAMQSRTKRIAALSAEANEEKEESPIELFTKEIAALTQKWNALTVKRRVTSLQLAPIQRSQNQDEAKEKDGEAKAKDKVKDKDNDKDNKNEKEEEEDNEEEEVTNLLPTMANTANISHPLSGLTTVKEEAAEVDAVAPTPSAMRATALTPATTTLILATPAPERWAIRLTRTSTTAGLRETRPGKWAPHSHFPGRWQHYQQQQQ
jgi:hypothetical protein